MEKVTAINGVLSLVLFGIGASLYVKTNALTGQVDYLENSLLEIKQRDAVVSNTESIAVNDIETESSLQAPVPSVKHQGTSSEDSRIANEDVSELAVSVVDKQTTLPDAKTPKPLTAQAYQEVLDVHLNGTLLETIPEELLPPAKDRALHAELLQAESINADLEPPIDN